MKTESNIISEWLDKNGDPKIEIQVLNEVIDKLLEQQSKMFTPDEVKNILFEWSVYKVSTAFTDGEVMDYEQWFEQFKNK